MALLSRLSRYVFFALMCLLPVAGYSQSGSGRVQGTVHDPSGSVVPDATVLIHSVDRGTDTILKTNSDGLFVAPPLVIGNYSVQVTAEGFRKWEGQLVLRVNQVADVNPTLTLGVAAQQVTVVGDVTPLVNDSNATIGTTLDFTRIQDLPENGRSVSNLVQLTTPGITGSGSGLKANGVNANAFEFVQDGAALANQDYGGQTQKLPDPDSIGEVKVETSNSSAKFNRPSTAILSTKSGTNRIHGALYETMRNNSFGIAKSRSDTFTKAPQLIRNEFGASIGGPVFVPHLYDGRDKSFFFVAFSGLELRQSVSQLWPVPTDAMRNGDFSGLTTSSGQPITIYDPGTTVASAQCSGNSGAANPACRTPFPGNIIPASRESPLAQKVYAILPHASLPNVNPSVASNLDMLVPNNDSERSLTLRLDQHFSDTNNAYFRFTHGTIDPYHIGSSNYGPPATNLSANITFAPVYTDSGSLVWNHIFSPHFYVESMVTDSYESDKIYTGPNPNVNYAANFGLPNAGALGFPNIYGIGFMAYGLGRNDNTRENSQNIAVWDENLTYIKGNHVLQFGGRYRHERTWILADQNPTPTTVNFSALGTGLLDPGTISGGSYTSIGLAGHTNASFFLGDASYYTVSEPMQWYHFRNQEIATYFQDDWKVTPKLTLNLGIRWEIHPALHETYDLFGGYDFNTNSIVTGAPLSKLYAIGLTTPQVVANYTGVGASFESGAQAGLPGSLVNGNYHDIAPRVGFAYNLFGGKHQTVLRGGYGTYIYPPPTRNFYAETRQNPPFSASYTQSYTAAAQAPDGLPNYMLRSVQTIIAGQNSTGVVNLNAPGSVSIGSFGASGLDRHYPSTFVHQWNFTIEHSLPLNSVVSATYLGNHGSNLEQYWEYDDGPSAYTWYENTGLALPTGSRAAVATLPYPNLPYGYIENQRKTGYSNNNSLQLQYQRLHKNGYGFQIFYLLSNDFRNGGNGWRDSFVEPSTLYLNGTVPTDDNARNRYVNYQRDLTIPQHEIRWNWVVDVPVGHGKRFMGNSSRLMDAVVGGWQIASTGHLLSQRWQPSTTYFQPTTMHLYKKKYKVQDCRSGTCFNDYFWYNGYISANQINVPNGVQGLPAGYTAYNGPLIRTPANGGSTSDPNYAYYNTNSVVVALANGKTVRTTYSPGYAPTQNWSVQGPFNWTMDASVFKAVTIREGLVFRFNADFFNVLNMQGLNNPDVGSGLISLRTSYNTPRQLQLTARLIW